MLYKQLLSLLLLLPPLLFSSCDKNNNTPNCPGSNLPPITTSGNNTFGCRIEGEDWSPYVKPSTYPDPLFIPALVVDYSEQQKGFSLLITKRFSENCGDINQSISWGIKHNSDLEIISSFFWFSDRNDGVGSYIIDSNSNLQLDILRFDTINRIFSGEFAFTIKLEDEAQTHTITDGRFDLQY